jgi:pilus assembly protein CpaC
MPDLTHTIRIYPWLRRIVASAVIAMTAVPAGSAAPNSAKPEIRQNAPLAIETDKALLIQLPEPARTVFVANPEIADVQVPTPTSFLVYGKKPGTTTVFAISDTGVTASYSVSVTRSTAEVAAALRSAVPNAPVEVSGTSNGITISGSVNSPRDAERLKAAAKQSVGDKDTVNLNVGVGGSTQVTLRVRIAEVSRTVSKQLGVNWSALANVGTIGRLAGFPALGLNVNSNPTAGISPSGNLLNLGGNLNAVITALNQEGLATILAEPYLTAISGETASFLAGGEYPIPVPQGLQIVTIEYKRFGISLDFTPTVLDGNRISIKVRPEVSQLSTVGQLTLDGVSVPALTVRRAETTVELGSGESFVIAGLYQNNGSNQIQNLPGVGDIPVLGALFRSTSFQRNESELVIIVTPYIVRPVARPNSLHLPTDGLRYSSDIERILSGRLAAQEAQTRAAPIPASAEPRLRGDAGFMQE